MEVHPRLEGFESIDQTLSGVVGWPQTLYQNMWSGKHVSPKFRKKPLGTFRYTQDQHSLLGRLEKTRLSTEKPTPSDRPAGRNPPGAPVA